jgi:superfamily II DNA or RNA helicase
MRFKIISPTKALILSASDAEISNLISVLTYTNTAMQHQAKRLYNNHWLRNSNKIKWEKDLEDIKAKVKQTLVWQENGQYYVRPGSLPHLGETTACHHNTENLIKYPSFKKVPWKKQLPFELHPYQDESWQKLLDIKHGHVEITTGAGKTAIILKLCREAGLRTAVVAPSKDIFEGLVEQFETYLGKDKVGMFGNGKKKLDKKFTICIDDSLVNIEPGTKEWDFFSNLDMLIVDESHVWGAETLENLCNGIFANIPYRFFMSATQSRGDGGGKLLQSIIGKCVYTLTTAEALAGCYISDHIFRIVSIESSNPNFGSSDPLEEKRIHYLNNRNIATFAAKLANSMALTSGEQTLILVEELSQIAMIVPLLKVPFAYAHSEKRKQRLEELGIEKTDNRESVRKFNASEVKVLIGTSCIATGTNIFPTHHTVNWVGGSSQIRTKQGAVGRSVRLHEHNPWKDKCVRKLRAVIWDFDIRDNYTMKRHLDDRISYYQDSGTEIKAIRLK